MGWDPVNCEVRSSLELILRQTGLARLTDSPAARQDKQPPPTTHTFIMGPEWTPESVRAQEAEALPVLPHPRPLFKLLLGKGRFYGSLWQK